MDECPYLDRAIYYRVEDIPSASSIGSQLANILEQLYNTGGLSKTILKVLEKQRLVALSRLASKAISRSEFLELAEQEQKKRRGYHVDFKYKPPFSQICMPSDNTVERSNAKESPQQRQTKENAMRTNYVLIDFENVQPESLAALQQDHFKVLLFVGANQAKVPFEIANDMHAMCDRAEYVKISRTGSNALDFHIAYYLGQLSEKDPHAYFHVISKDTGFDPLIDYMKTKGISVIRENTIEAIPLLTAPQPPASPKAPPPPAKPPQPAKPVSPPRLIVRPTVPPPPVPVKKPAERFAVVLQNLRLLKASKPRKVKSLTSHIKALIPNAITDADIAKIIADLRSRKHIIITDNKITYNL